MQSVWRPHVTVAAVIERDGRFLMIEEETNEGVRLNQPAGHLERDESLVDAVVRETLEESAWTFLPQWLVGVYRWTRPDGDVTYLRFAFSGKSLRENAGRRLDSGIVRTLWMTPDELRASIARHRSPMVMQCVDDWCAGKRFSLDLLAHFE